MIIFPLPYQIEKDTKLVANVQQVIFYHFFRGFAYALLFDDPDPDAIRIQFIKTAVTLITL